MDGISRRCIMNDFTNNLKSLIEDFLEFNMLWALNMILDDFI